MKFNRKTNSRIALPGSCSVSTPFVHPANWKTVRASTAKDWYIFYRFYDPVRKPAGKAVMVKGMNAFKDPASRRHATEQLLYDAMADLKGGYNPVVKEWAEIRETGDLHEYTPMMAALRLALKTCACVEEMRKDMSSTLTYVEMAAIALSFENMPVRDVRKKHIRRILDTCATITSRYDERWKKERKVRWTDHKYNKYRSHLMMLFSEIAQVDAVEANPVTRELKRKNVVVKRAVILSDVESNRVNAVLRWYVPEFWIFTQIFFHSGARKTEITRLKGKDVDLERQVFTRVIKKDKPFREVETTIKDIAMPFWRQALKHCGPEDYIFSEGLVPGAKPIRPDQINRRWTTWIKKPLGIHIDFYKLKHLNTTQTAAIAGERAAASHNAHTSTAMVVKIYDVGRESREHEAMKKVNNPFGA